MLEFLYYELTKASTIKYKYTYSPQMSRIGKSGACNNKTCILSKKKKHLCISFLLAKWHKALLCQRNLIQRRTCMPRSEYVLHAAHFNALISCIYNFFLLQQSKMHKCSQNIPTQSENISRCLPRNRWKHVATRLQHIIKMLQCVTFARDFGLYEERTCTFLQNVASPQMHLV